MATRSKNKKTVKVKMSPESIKEIKHLQTLLKYSVRAADGSSEQLDELFSSQANKIQIQIEKLKGNQ